jgi:hypothetical protein
MPAVQPQRAQTSPQVNQPIPNPVSQANFPVPQGHPFLRNVPIFYHQGEWFPIPDDQHPLRSLVVKLAAQQAAETKLAIEAKCQLAHANYALHLLNDAITDTERDLATVDPANPKIVLPKNIQPTSVLERLVISWVHSGAFAQAAALIRAGSNFFRDPRALGGIAKGQKPICLCCEQSGMVLDATFCEIVPGKVNVLAVEDHVQWGVSVAFACRCCNDQGFAWLGPDEI